MVVRARSRAYRFEHHSNGFVRGSKSKKSNRFHRKNRKMLFDGKRFGPTIVVGDTLRRVKRATDEYDGRGTCRWGLLQVGIVCERRMYRSAIYSMKPYSFIFDHGCTSSCESNLTVVVVVASPSHTLRASGAKQTANIPAVSQPFVRDWSGSRSLAPSLLPRGLHERKQPPLTTK